jgi:hypothetical protein
MERLSPHECTYTFGRRGVGVDDVHWLGSKVPMKLEDGPAVGQSVSPSLPEVVSESDQPDAF